MPARSHSVERTLRGFGPFADVSAGTLAELSPGACARRLPRGAQLFREGGPSTEVFLLSRGLVSLHQAGVEQAKIVLDFAGPGDIVGAADDAFAHGAAAGVASEHVHVIVLKTEAIAGVARRDRALRRALAAKAARGSSRLERKLRTLVAGQPSARLATALLDLTHRYARAGAGGLVLPFALPACELAAFADVPRALAADLLERWAAWELIYPYDDALVVKAPRALAGLANGDRAGAEVPLAQSGTMRRCPAVPEAGDDDLASAG
jgi:CRP-like cAMP-binding protein